jgi:Cu/Ag efflux protein CusF
MKKLIVISAAFCTVFTVSHPALAADGMAGMKMEAGMMGGAAADSPVLTDATVKKVDSSTGMVTLEHGALANVGMPAMTMAFKAKDAAMVQQAKEGEKVRVRIENIDGTMTIVKLVKQ